MNEDTLEKYNDIFYIACNQVDDQSETKRIELSLDVFSMIMNFFPSQFQSWVNIHSDESIILTRWGQIFDELATTKTAKGEQVSSVIEEQTSHLSVQDFSTKQTPQPPIPQNQSSTNGDYKQELSVILITLMIIILLAYVPLG